MPPKSLTVGQRLSLNRSSPSIPGPSSSSNSAPPAPVVVATVVSRVGANARSWNLRIESENIDLQLSSRAIHSAIAADAAPPPRENLRERRPLDRGAFISDAQEDDEDDGSDDSLDDESSPSSESEAEEKKIPPPRADSLAPHGLRWAPLPEYEVIRDIRNLFEHSMTLRWNLLGLEQFGGSASDI